MSIEIGDPAFPFKLPYQPGEFVDLEDHLGESKIVLLFFPLAFSGVCTTELRAVRDRWAEFADLDAAVFGISVDSPFVTAKFREVEGIPFPLLSDFNRDASEAWDVLYEEFFGLHGVSKRAAFVIDSEGRVTYKWVSEDSNVEPDYEALRAALAAAS